MSASAAFRRRDANASESIAAIMNPNMGYREKLRHRGIKPKDYERANRVQLKQLQIQQRELRQREEAAKREEFKLTRFKTVQARVYQAQIKDDSSVPKRHDFLRRGASTFALKKDQRKPDRPVPLKDSARTNVCSPKLPVAMDRQRKYHVKPPIPSRQELEELNEMLAKLHHKEPPDYVNGNAWEVINKTPPQLGGDADVDVKHNSFGRIPEYLLLRKERWAREEEERRRNTPDPDCPPGMMLLAEEERLHTLAVLHESFEEVRMQMNRLPLRIEMPSQVRRKNELEARLQEIEDAIKVFNRSKVYVAKPFALEGAGPQTNPEQRRIRSRRNSHSSTIAA